MQAKLLAWFLSFAGAVGKKMLIESKPVLFGLSRELGMTIYDLAADEFSDELTEEDKAIAVKLALKVGKTQWDVCKEQGLLLLDDSVSLLTQAAESEIQSELGIF